MVPISEEMMAGAPANTIVAVFWAGATASVSLCAAARLPIVLAYVAGTGKSKRHSLILSTFFTLGLILSIVLLGMTTASAADGIHRVLHADKGLFQGLGVALFIVGILVSGLICPQILPQRLHSTNAWLGKAGSLLGAFLSGGALGLLQTPACSSCGPALLALVETAGAPGSSLPASLVLVSFAAGQSLMVLAIGIMTSLIRPDLIIWLRTLMCSVEQRIQLVAGNILIVLGIYFVIVG